MSYKLICSIQKATLTYEIEIQVGQLFAVDFPNSLPREVSSFIIISDHIVAKIYGEALQASLHKAGKPAYLFSFPAGEHSKTRATKEHLENQCFEKGLGRDSCVIAIGGGVVTDLAGFLAATYCRGIPLVMIPTSLLGMVDASIGGKTGVDVPYGKNMVGCIYQPQKIIIDPSALKTLPLRELKNGVVEMIKHGLIADKEFFDLLDSSADNFMALDLPLIEKCIYQSCLIKKAIVEEDEQEAGKRRLLNFGHTIGHAIEHESKYSLAHGEAVAIGMLVEGHIAVQLGQLQQLAFERIHNILVKYAIPLRLPKSFELSQLLEAMHLDKKSLKGAPRFVILNNIGSALSCQGAYCCHVAGDVLIKALKWMQQTFSR